MSVVVEQRVSPSQRQSYDSVSSYDEFIPVVLPQNITVPIDIDSNSGGNKTLRVDQSDSGSFQDSGVEDDLILPDKETCSKIVAEVEQYFSDASIRNDPFLLKHVKRNKEGFVSLKLVSGFKRLKHLTRDWRVVAHVLKSSEKIQINDTGNKIRRVDPLPEFNETTLCRTIFVLNLPMEKPTIGNVAELFAKCGEIALVRVLRPGNPLPQDVRQYVCKHPQIGTSVCALVEYETIEAAKIAEKTMSSNDCRELQVLRLAAKKQEPQNKQEAKTKTGAKKSRNVKKVRVEKQINDDSASSSDTDSRSQKNIATRWNQGSTAARFGETSSCWRRHALPTGPEISSSPPRGPWMQRQLLSDVNSYRMVSVTPSNVVRQPRGPDGTSGFHPGSRGVRVATESC